MIEKVCDKDFIFLDVDLKTKRETFEFIAQKASELKILTNKKALVDGFVKREMQGSTGFEDGFAIPHARIKQLKRTAVFVIRFKHEVDWGSMDGQKTKVAIALLVVDGSNGDQHIELLSQIAVKLIDPDFKEILKKSRTYKAILEALQIQQQTTSTKNLDQPEVKISKSNHKIVAVTSCVVGIAHTYMAEEKLLQAGLKTNNHIRVETQWSKGVGTELTKKEIKEAEVVIIAADTAVDLSRFAGKRIYKTKVAEAIKDPELTIQKALESAVVLSPKNKDFEIRNRQKEEKTGILQHVLVGISYMFLSLF
ncbi:fructose PTS transporter subunit IIB [Mycoplasma putrefaciens]|uniref:fructose PTS transporter subunit IIB n=1 Tax=Mycoplasma putrefaciens TaxID=2123 RepID=UPI00039D4D1E|nr:fructose PTS transporter subunit IIB [Mycoplasma putrefaciens]